MQFLRRPPLLLGPSVTEHLIQLKTAQTLELAQAMGPELIVNLQNLGQCPPESQCRP